MDRNFITITEVGLRDGLQNEPNIVPTPIKLELIGKLIDANVSIIEATSFVSPKWVPQMSDHTELVKALTLDGPTKFPVLVPNLKGLDNALASGVKDIAVFAAASDTFSSKNINCSTKESIVRFKEVIKQAKMQGLNVRGYVSCVLGCPYEGEISPSQVAYVANALFEAGCYEISLGDTIGVGTPHKATKMLKECTRLIPIEHLSVHFHDTYGQALANIYACLQEGVQVIDSAIAGLGGCPYAKGASGNVATEDVLYLLQGLNLKTGIDLDKMIMTGQWICDYLKRDNNSKVAKARLSKA
jgi:hydroxymethylglutaryl-CoA lyase